ncbi:D-alanyl-D-alanine carboxypeptidase/D-alanyl-D-alanine endopeptidase [Peribacillus loiseleuriae]|uniref:D-alanyl-D-alanine carboxypeptidase n=1 Tax=Peribacillus loiseleuriae TaxID=1679170 RepID=A0A0K9H012_9BACI|nr:D-alanyl-D-alanine carboxypeptidase/D-alanyl-D-alanine-endopeptidase [Peribacillus loiseleuriae]KMY52196.1 D-alanyl-D-alanine carboxypeptidase [Peribacillus loiseleuriae]
MKYKIKVCVLLLLIFVFTLVQYVEKANGPVLAASGSTFEQQLHPLLADEKLSGAVLGISIRQAATGEVIYEHGGDVRLRPASNMKLLTAAAALETLGENYVFKTELFTDGVMNGDVLTGNLYIKGKGDPTLLQADLDTLATVIKNKGIKTVVGNVIGDDTWYDCERYSVDMIWSDEGEYYGAAISALTIAPNEDYDSGTAIVDVTSGMKVGEGATVKVTPQTEYVKIVNLAKTVAADGKKEIKIVREHRSNTITITGTIPVKSSRTRQWVALWEPTVYTTHVFKNALQAQGITHVGFVKAGKVPNQAKLLATHDSMPLSQLLVPFMKLSNNAHAEHLVKEMGKVIHGEGSWETGLEVVGNTVQSLGMNPTSLKLRDGSGISQINLISANELTKLLYAVQAKVWYPAYVHSLPVAGDSDRFIGGTLRNRMTNTFAAGNVQAKTGTLAATSTLSGYVTTKSGERFIFSILFNNFVDGDSITKIQDDIVVLLAERE